MRGAAILILLMIAFATGCAGPVSRQEVSEANSHAAQGGLDPVMEEILQHGLSVVPAIRFRQVQDLKESALAMEMCDCGKKTEDHAIRLLGSDDPDLRAIAIVILKKCAGANGARLLARMALGGTEEERYAAIQALGSVGGHEDVLIQVIEDAANADLRDAAARSLGDLRSWKSVPALRRLCRKTMDAKVKCGILYGLGRIGDRSVVPLLVEELGSHEASIATAAAEALRSCGDGRAVDPLLSVVQKSQVGATLNLWASSALLDSLIDTDSSATPEQIAVVWNQLKPMYDLESCLRDALRGARSEGEIRRVLLRISRANVMGLAPDLEILIKTPVMQRSYVERKLCMQMLGEWHNATGLYGVTGFLDESGILRNVPKEQWNAYRNSALDVLRRATGQNFWLDAVRWREYLDQQFHGLATN